MFTATDYDKLQQIMKESPEKKELLTRLLESHKTEISTISHEIRNPLTLIYSTLQMIESQHREVRDFRHWKSMRQDIEYMTQLLEELSTYNNGECLHLSAVDTVPFLETLVLSFAASILDTNIEFTSRIKPDIPSVTMDPIKIRQLLLNLLGNAKDALLACPDLEYPAIGLHTECTDRTVRFLIMDNGSGIRAEDIGSIFDPFVTHKVNGTGLGLAIARRIINAHNGSLNVESTLGKGSVFTVILPIQQDT